jgi:hypothetical protein
LPMNFFKGFVLSLTASTATISVMRYVAWMSTLSDADKWLRDSFPYNFHYDHILSMSVFVLVTWLVIGLSFVLPVFFAYLLAERFKITSVIYYAAGGIIGAGASALAFVEDPRFQEYPKPRLEQFTAGFWHFFPVCLIGAVVFWWATGRKVV